MIESPRVPGHYFSLPVMFRLYLNKKSAAKWHRTYYKKTAYKKTELMRDMLNRLQRHLGKSEKALHFLGDSAFTAPVLLNELPIKIEVTGRVVATARLHEPPPARSRTSWPSPQTR